MLSCPPTSAPTLLSLIAFLTTQLIDDFSTHRIALTFQVVTNIQINTTQFSDPGVEAEKSTRGGANNYYCNLSCSLYLHFSRCWNNLMYQGFDVFM